MQTFTKGGLDAVLTPENCVRLLIDHQPSQLANVNSHEPTMVIKNVTALAKTAGVPTILTTISTKRGGEIFKQIQAVFPYQKPIDRTFINSWEDGRVVEAVKRTGRKKLVIAALWSEMCLAQPAIHAMGEGHNVYAVTDASGGVSAEANDMAIRRLVAAGAQPITWLGMAGELQRDWARAERLAEITSDEAIAAANRAMYSLTSSILSGNTYKAFEMAPKVLAGIVNVNSPTVNDEIHAPMGGVRDSGWGRTGPRSLDDFSDLIWINSHSGQRQYPF